MAEILEFQAFLRLHPDGIARIKISEGGGEPAILKGQLITTVGGIQASAGTMQNNRMLWHLVHLQPEREREWLPAQVGGDPWREAKLPWLVSMEDKRPSQLSSGGFLGGSGAYAFGIVTIVSQIGVLLGVDQVETHVKMRPLKDGFDATPVGRRGQLAPESLAPRGWGMIRQPGIKPGTRPVMGLLPCFSGLEQVSF